MLVNSSSFGTRLQQRLYSHNSMVMSYSKFQYHANPKVVSCLLEFVFSLPSDKNIKRTDWLFWLMPNLSLQLLSSINSVDCEDAESMHHIGGQLCRDIRVAQGKWMHPQLCHNILHHDQTYCKWLKILEIWFVLLHKAWYCSQIITSKLACTAVPLCPSPIVPLPRLLQKTVY